MKSSAPRKGWYFLFNDVAETKEAFGKRTHAAYELSDESIRRNMRMNTIWADGTKKIAGAMGFLLLTGLTPAPAIVSGVFAVAASETFIRMRMQQVLKSEQERRKPQAKAGLEHFRR